MKVSVIIPVFNSEQYLEQCLDSIISQSLDNYEIIIVDDGSTDSSAKIIDHYSSKCDRIRLHEHRQNLGVSAARNAGIELATGEYIIFIDADDYWTETTLLETLYTRAVNDSSDLVQFEFTRQLSDSSPVMQQAQQGRTISILASKDWHIRYSVWSLLISKALIDSNNIRFDVDLVMGEDALFSCTLYCNAKTLSLLEITGYYYRSSDNSANNAAWNSRKIFSTVRWFRHAIDVIKNSPAYQARQEILYNIASERLISLTDRLAAIAVSVLDEAQLQEYISHWADCFHAIDSNAFDRHLLTKEPDNKYRQIYDVVFDNSTDSFRSLVSEIRSQPDATEITISSHQAKSLGEKLLRLNDATVQCHFDNGITINLPRHKAHQLARQLIESREPFIKLKISN